MDAKAPLRIFKEKMDWFEGRHLKEVFFKGQFSSASESLSIGAEHN